MFKYTATLLIAAMAVSSSMAVSIPMTEHRAQEPAAAESSNVVVHKKHAKPDKIVFMSEMSAHAEDDEVGQRGLLDSGLLSGLIGVAGLPKKIIGAVASSALAHLKSVDLKKLVKISLLAALVTVLGAVATVSVAGLVSLVSAVCAVVPYLKLVFGGHHHDKGESGSESQIDLVSEFVLGALGEYGGGKRKA